MSAAVIRADASRELGSGHVARCLALAHRLRDLGMPVSFVSRAGENDALDAIAGAGFDAFALPAARYANDRYAKPLQEEIAEMQAALDGSPARLLVVDQYALDAAWESHFRARGLRIAAIDDKADRPHDCDVLVDQNLSALQPDRYAGLLPAEAQTFFGPRYALLRREFDTAARRERTGEVREVLVLFGGFDASNETAKALRALAHSPFAGARVHAVLRADAPHYHTVAALCRDLGFDFDGEVRSMAALMAQADFALGACGGAQWERCAVGLPALLVSLASNQEPGAQACADAGIARYAGKAAAVTVDELIGELEWIARNPDWIRAASRAQLRLMGSGEPGAQIVARRLAELAA